MNANVCFANTPADEEPPTTKKFRSKNPAPVLRAPLGPAQ